MASCPNEPVFIEIEGGARFCLKCILKHFVPYRD